MSRRRTLHPEEETLWQAVARTARPLHASPRRKLDLPTLVLTHPKPPAPSVAPNLPAFRIGEKARGHDLASTAQPASPVQMDAKAFARMSRGKLQPEARLDLHGLTLAEAQPELIRFILNAQSAGLRLVLVITGKGKAGPDHGPIPQRMGVLRHQTPLWLRQPPLGPAVLQIAESHLKHGGAGAFYVYLRRSR